MFFSRRGSRSEEVKQSSFNGGGENMLAGTYWRHYWWLAWNMGIKSLSCQIATWYNIRGRKWAWNPHKPKSSSLSSKGDEKEMFHARSQRSKSDIKTAQDVNSLQMCRLYATQSSPDNICLIKPFWKGHCEVSLTGSGNFYSITSSERWRPTAGKQPPAEAAFLGPTFDHTLHKDDDGV